MTISRNAMCRGQNERQPEQQRYQRKAGDRPMNGENVGHGLVISDGGRAPHEVVA
jgi:hypothetical protein